MDLITNLPPITLNNGTVVDTILSVVDHGLMKGVILTPCSKTLTEEGAGEILLHHIYKWFRLPNSIISDQDPQFTTKSFQELLKLLGIKLKLMTAYWPQSDGTTECFNQEIKAYIGIYCSSNPKTWHKSISTIEFTHNNWWHSDRQWMPFKLIMGTSPLTIPTTFEHTKFPSVEEQVQQLMKDWEAIAAHELARWHMAKQHKNKFSGFKLDQLVWLDTQNLKTKYHKKMAPKWEGPFWISKVLRLVTYQLDLPLTWWIHNIFHAVLLMPYIENEVHGPNFLWPPPDIEKMMKNNGKLRLYSTTDDTAEDTNTTSYGKDGQSLMQHGNPPHVSKMVVKPYSKNIDTDFIYKWTCHHAQQGNPDNHLHVPRGRSGRPSYPSPNDSVYSSNTTTTSHTASTHHLESIYNIQGCSSIRRNLHCSPILATTHLTPLHPVQIDIPPVKNLASKFTHHPSWTTNSMYRLIHWLGQQDAMRLHGTKKVPIPSWLWIVVWLHPQTQMGFYLQFWLSGGHI